MKPLMIALAFATAAAATPARARDKEWYVEADVGIAVAPPIQLDNASRQAIRTNYHIGYDVDGQVGYDFGLIRAEFEIGYRNAPLDKLQFPLVAIPAIPSRVDGVGNISTVSGTVNVLGDLKMRSDWTLWAGGGIGVAATKVDLGQRGAAVATFDNRNNVGFAWQLKAGVDKQLTDRLSVDLSYSYLSAQSRAFTTGGLATDFDAGYHSFTLGLRYSFGSLPPPPPSPLEHDK